ncbi:MAG: hypothetical protein WCA77_07995 [Thermoplasmata archaeon]
MTSSAEPRTVGLPAGDAESVSAGALAPSTPVGFDVTSTRTAESSVRGDAPPSRSIRERVELALPLLLIGGGCLAIGLLLWKQRGAYSSSVVPWELFLALGLSALAGGFVSLAVGPERAPLGTGLEDKSQVQGAAPEDRPTGPLVGVRSARLAIWEQFGDEPSESLFARGDGSDALVVVASEAWSEERSPLDEDYAESYLEEPVSLFSGVVKRAQDGPSAPGTILASPWPTTEEVTSELDRLRAALKLPLPTRTAGTALESS